METNWKPHPRGLLFPTSKILFQSVDETKGRGEVLKREIMHIARFITLSPT